MKITGILGSSRREATQRSFWTWSWRRLGDGILRPGSPCGTRSLPPVTDAWDVPGQGNVVIPDDMQEVYREIREADGIIWASPVYFWSMSGLTKNALDRTYALTSPKLQQAGKLAGLMLVTGCRRGCVRCVQSLSYVFQLQPHVCCGVYHGLGPGKGRDQEGRDGRHHG